jgi:hypothetical protein
MTPEIWIAIIVALGGSSGIYAIIKAVLDWKNGKASRESDADEKFNLRLDKRIEEEAKRAELLQAKLDAERDFNHQLVLTLVRHGIEVPSRAK